MALTRDLLDIRTIYHEPAVGDFPLGREILARFPTPRASSCRRTGTFRNSTATRARWRIG